LDPAIFDPSSITAGPFLGSLLSALDIQTDTYSPWHTLTADLSPFVGKSIFVAYRLVGPSSMGGGYQGLDNFNIGRGHGKAPDDHKASGDGEAR
jgi:hypothetical protein